MELVNTPLLNLEARVENRQRLTAMKKEIEKQIDTETDAIKNELAAMGVDELEVGNRLVTLQIRDRSTLDKTELISLGVTTDQIKRATKISTYLQLDVRDKK
jgi:2-hydroxychromene-2-carboxylate isomerase